MATTVGSEIPVNNFTSRSQSGPSIAPLSNGGFVVTWVSEDQDTDGYGVYAQRYHSDGTAYGSEFLVNTFITGNQGGPNIWGGNQAEPSVTALSDGGFVITWQSSTQDSGTAGVYGQQYNSDSSANGTEFQINTYTSNTQGYPAVTALRDNGFAVVWQSQNQDGDLYGIYAQRFDAGAGVGLIDWFDISASSSGGGGPIGGYFVDTPEPTHDTFAKAFNTPAPTEMIPLMVGTVITISMPVPKMTLSSRVLAQIRVMANRVTMPFLLAMATTVSTVALVTT